MDRRPLTDESGAFANLRLCVGDSDSAARSELFKGVEVLRRPSYGKMGEEKKVYANFIRLIFNEMTVKVYQIDLSFNPIVSVWFNGVPSPDEKGAIVSPYDRRRIFYEWMVDTGYTFCPHVNDYVYDGGSMIVARALFNFPDGADEFVCEFRCLMERDVYGGSAAGGGGRMQTVHLRISQRSNVHIDPNNLNEELSDTGDQHVTTPMQMMDIIMRANRTAQFDCDAGFYRKFFPVARGVFQLPVVNHQQGSYLGFGLYLWKGLFCSVRACGEIKAPMANFDVLNAAFHRIPGMRLNDYFADMFGAEWHPQRWAGPNGRQRIHCQQDLSKFQWPFENLRVKAIHVNGKSYTCARLYYKTAIDMQFAHYCPCSWCVTWSVCMFEWTARRATTPDDEEGNARVMNFLAGCSTFLISVYDYFRLFYQISLHWPLLPLVETAACGSRGNGYAVKYNYFPLEVLEVVTPQRFNGYLSGTSAVAIKESAKGPADRMKSIEDMVVDACFVGDPFLGRFGVGMNKGLVVARARILSAPRIRFGGNYVVMPEDGVFCTGVNKPMFYTPRQFNSFAVIYVSATAAVGDQLRGLSLFADNVGVIARPFLGGDCAEQALITKCTEPDGIKAALMECCDSAMAQIDHDSPSIVFCVMPKRNLDVYSEIKRIAEIELGVMTQCLLLSTAADVMVDATVCENFFMKVNCKLGGRTFVTEPTGSQEVSEMMSGKDGAVMVVGVDVLHPSSDAEPNMPSIATFLGSMDKELVTYKAVVKVLAVRNDHIVCTSDALSELLVVWMRKNPDTRMNNLIVFRDGVNEYHMEEVLRGEVRDLEQVLKVLNLTPDITYVFVDQQHHTRFFPMNSSDPSQVSGRFKNVLPGLVVDRDVTDSDFFEWYQAPQQCMQGTTCPVKYTCMRNDADLSPDSLQYLVHALCHSFQRCTRAVHCPAVVYYAHLAALRASYHLRKPVSEMSGGLGVNEPLGMKHGGDCSRFVRVHHDVIEKGMYFV